MSRRASARLAQLWQLPLLLLSVALFGYAAYLFIDPQPGLTIEERINSAKALIANERPDAANQLLNRILTTEKLSADHQGVIHLLIAESIDMAQKQKRLHVPANFVSIVEQTRRAQGTGAKLDWQAYRRLGEAYEALLARADSRMYKDKSAQKETRPVASRYPASSSANASIPSSLLP